MGRGASAAARRRWPTESELPESARQTVFDEHVDAIGEPEIQPHASRCGIAPGHRNDPDLLIARAKPLNDATEHEQTEDAAQCPCFWRGAPKTVSCQGDRGGHRRAPTAAGVPSGPVKGPTGRLRATSSGTRRPAQGRWSTLGAHSVNQARPDILHLRPTHSAITPACTSSGHRKFKRPGQGPRRTFDGLKCLDSAPVPSRRAVSVGPWTVHQGRWRSSPQG